SLVLELSNDRLYGLSRNIEGNANRPTRRREDRGVDPNDLAFHVEGGAAGIALVHGRVDLDIVVIRARTDVAAASRKDPSRYCPTEAEWVPNRNYPVADTRRRVRKFDEGEVVAAIHLDQGEVGTRISADHLGVIRLAIIGRDLNGLRLVHDVIVGHSITVSSDKEARALASHELTVRL